MKDRTRPSRRQLLALAGAGGLLFLTQEAMPARRDLKASRPASKPLFLHWCKPTYYLGDNKTDPPSRILSTRVVLGEDINITLGKGTASSKE